MPIITEILAQVWPFILAAAGLLFGYVRHKQAQTQVEQAGREIAEAQKREAQAGAAVARANETAAQAGAKNQEVRREIDNASAVPDANSVLRAEGWQRD